MKPTIGRIVIYRTLAGTDLPAIIISTTMDVSGDALSEGCCELHVFWHGRPADYLGQRGVPGPFVAPGQWHWPERV